jgi:hypothetical protein
MNHPFEYLTPNHQKTFFIYLLILSIVIMIIMNVIGKSLTTVYAPAGIISFELAFPLPAPNR